jgi:diguanylate cyclase (GGDEF)-like protein
MTDVAWGEQTVFLSNLPAGRRERGFACAIVVISSGIFLLLGLFARVPLGPLTPFIAIYQSALVVNDLITAAFLLGQCRVSRSDALGCVAGGYLFTALMAIVHALTFPGLFTPTGLLGAGPQTTVWLYMFWHGGFPLFIIAYAGNWPKQQHAGAGGKRLLRRMAAVLVAAFGFSLLATMGQSLLPALLDNGRYTPMMIVAITIVWLLNLAAMTLLLHRRPYTVLDLWLIVVLCAWLFDIALSALFNAARYDVGFYGGRIYGLLAASLVLVVLLHENAKLYLQLHKLRDSDRAKAAELHRLSVVDPLTGIANRRAFEDALDQEWRRMARHQTALSLLMIDVDYFKRFNDSYGHVAGDQCLRAVAQALAGRARRAGEMAARYGGEEFAVLLPHTEIAAAGKLAGVIVESVRERAIPHRASEVAPYVTVSIGVASIADLPASAGAFARDGGTTAATVLIEAADQALYRAKTGGRNRVAVAGMDDTDPVAEDSGERRATSERCQG